jgi:hypothetical protein
VKTGLSARWVSLGAGFVALMWGIYLYRTAFSITTSDTVALLAGARVAWVCIESGSAPCAGVTQFPLAHHLLVLPGVARGWSDIDIARLLSLVSVFSVAAMVYLCARIGGVVAGGRGAVLAGAVALSGPWIFYTGTTWGEPLAAALLLLPVAVMVLWRANPLVLALTALAASTTKEVAGLTVILLVVALVVREYSVRSRRWCIVRISAMGLGVIAAVVLNSALNLFRYGSVQNEVYLTLVPRPPIFWFVPKTFGALWLSPSGGVLPYWPLAVAVLLVVVALVIGGLKAPSRAAKIACWLVVTAVVLNTLLLADFAAPFGWVAWGPRLALPWVLPVFVAGAFIERRRMQRWVAFVYRHLGLSVVVIAAGVVAGVLLNAAARLTMSWLAFWVPRPEDPYCPRIMFMSEPASYFRCVESMVWDRNGPMRIVIDEYRVTQATAPAIAAIGIAVVVVVGMIVTRRSSPDMGGHSPAS